MPVFYWVFVVIAGEIFVKKGKITKRITEMKDFAAIDFETANSERSSVCSVGVVIVRDGEMVDSFYSLIQPEPN